MGVGADRLDRGLGGGRGLVAVPLGVVRCEPAGEALQTAVVGALGLRGRSERVTRQPPLSGRRLR